MTTKIKASITKKWCRQGDRNPNVTVWGIQTSDGGIYETCGNYAGHAGYPDPIRNVREAELGQVYTIVYGTAVTYAHPTLVGIDLDS